MSRGIGGHHHAHRGRSNDWLTPPELLAALGPFDLDPCASERQPWRTAVTEYTRAEDGLARPWPAGSFVWLNPPYGSEAGAWVDRLARHGNGLALLFARTETRWFFESVWPAAWALFFLRGRLTFHLPGDGRASRAGHNSGGPSVLIAYGAEATARLWRLAGPDSQFPGRLVCLHTGPRRADTRS
jgi:hypothetical protein